MYACLGPGDVGIDRPFPDTAALAAASGFDGVNVDVGYLREHGPEQYRSVLDRHGLRPGSLGLPFDVTAAREEYERHLAAFPEIADRAAAVGCTRCSTYIMSFSDERPFEENAEFHRTRLEPVAKILAERGIDFGLEFLGPKTLRDGHEYEFVHTADGMLDLCSGIDADNLGLLLDSWHWYTSGAGVDALERLDRDDVVDVHVNDAPSGVPRDEQVDSVRCLPGATGVIDIEAFVSQLDRMGYDGPVTAEPFSDEVEAMDDEDAAARTAESLRSVLAHASN